MGRVSVAADLGRMTFESLDRWRWLLWYHRPQQLARRLCYRLRDRFLPRYSPNFNQKIPGVRFESLSRWAEWDAPGTLTPEEDLSQGKLTLINLSCDLGWPIRWSPSTRSPMPPLWEFHLQYHEYLLGLSLPQWTDSARSLAQNVVNDWLDRYEHRPDLVAWHPYCISRRFWVWTRLLAEGVPANANRHRWLRSLATQMGWLERRLERDLGGNHLWENARALVAAGVFFKGEHADRWWKAGTELLNSCLAEQLLPWGEHFERSPMYQADLSRGLAELSVVVYARDQKISERLRDVASRMRAAFLDAIRHPDGSIPLFGDSSLDGEETRCSYQPLPGRDRSEWVGEYYIHRVADHQLTFDAGNMGPDDLPAHAHADLLGFELSAFGERIIVDSGVHSYTGPERELLRSTKAHNVLVVNDEELADTWSSFRMGRRGHVLRRDSGRISTGRWIVAAHDGYSHLGIRETTRLWLLADEGLWFCVDLAESERSLDVVSLVHWAPSVSLTPAKGGFLVAGTRGNLFWQPIGEVKDVAVRPSLYAERFYTPLPNERWEIRALGAARCVYRLDACP